jgi:hypothetical protein
MPQPSTLPGQRMSAAASMRSPTGRREARLRPEFATRYPGIQPGVWESAAVLCDRVLAGGLLRGSPMGWRHRVLAPEHFEFRGELPKEERPRREDR